jgi:hypothetical protein
MSLFYDILIEISTRLSFSWFSYCSKIVDVSTRTICNTLNNEIFWGGKYECVKYIAPLEIYTDFDDNSETELFEDVLIRTKHHQM